MKPKTVDVVLFDIDGVLVELTGVGDLLRWTPSDFDEANLWAYWLGPEHVRAFETGKTTSTEFALAKGPDELRKVLEHWLPDSSVAGSS